MRKRDYGAMGEDDARSYLMTHGYEILAANYRRVTGEIDLIARKGPLVAFVEVKRRTSNRLGRPAEAVTAAKQRSILRTAMIYAQENGLDDVPLRFDVIEVIQGSIQHIEGAFDATGIMD